jgi:hypothetical protein
VTVQQSLLACTISQEHVLAGPAKVFLASCTGAPDDLPVSFTDEAPVMRYHSALSWILGVGGSPF